jgi:pSer/pThr/pTyr-binding forkhead associated (FHA) protein
MGALTLLILRLVFLAVLWAFVFAVVYALRSDLFGQRARKQSADVAPTPFSSEPFVAAPLAPPPPPARPTVAPPTEPIRRPQQNASPAAGPARRLVITSGPKAGLEIELPSEQLAIGRSSESGLVIRDDYTSTHHARLMLWNDGWVVQDLDSTNGTFLDGARVTLPTPVPIGAPVTIGTTTFELRR